MQIIIVTSIPNVSRNAVASENPNRATRMGLKTREIGRKSSRKAVIPTHPLSDCFSHRFSVWNLRRDSVSGPFSSGYGVQKDGLEIPIYERRLRKRISETKYRLRFLFINVVDKTPIFFVVPACLKSRLDNFANQKWVSH